jgi:hypothetical protein
MINLLPDLLELKWMRKPKASISNTTQIYVHPVFLEKSHPKPMVKCNLLIGKKAPGTSNG